VLSVHFLPKLTCPTKGGTGSILEYFGPGVAAQSCTGNIILVLPSNENEPNDTTGLATMANMGAEVGATTSTFPYSSNMRSYLKATGRSAVAAAADDAASKGFLSADQGAEYDDVIEIVSSSPSIHTGAHYADIESFRARTNHKRSIYAGSLHTTISVWGIYQGEWLEG
jgi:hypothetical protein